MPWYWWIAASLSLATNIVSLAQVIAIKSAMRQMRKAFDAYRESTALLFQTIAQQNRKAREHAVAVAEAGLGKIETKLDTIAELNK